MVVEIEFEEEVFTSEFASVAVLVLVLAFARNDEFDCGPCVCVCEDKLDPEVAATTPWA